ncbi:MAG: gfo/Idh/MocA family oxidoreductase [Planctomycetota bacterium]|nr:MAG: gfo/Idh/MocA family oxidoreductase [Planctomycetota bacterium]
MATRPDATRRRFLKAAGAAIAAPYVITSTALGAGNVPPASDRIVVAGIGIGNMGRGDQVAFLRRNDVQYVAVCDVRASFRNEAKAKADAHYGNRDCQSYNDYREILQRPDIDVVHIATPDHWHTIMVTEACREGKDVYCQKPETLTLREGPLMIDAARRYARVVSGGSQRVLEDYRRIVDPCWGGRYGNIESINVLKLDISKRCNLPAEPVPDDIDWEMWLGPAPWAPYNAARCDGNFSTVEHSWRSYDDYSGGAITDWGAHHFGGATFAIDVRELQPIAVDYGEGSRGPYLTFRYPNGRQLHHNHPEMAHLQVVGDGHVQTAKPVPRYKGQGGIYGDFIECVKTRERPFRDIELAINTMVVCHLGTAAYKLRRSLKWDVAAQRFTDDAEANRLLDRARREPWIL